MESCLKLLPKKSYNKYCYLLLVCFVSIGIIVIGIATAFHSEATLQCNPDKTLASDLATRKYIEAKCLLKYAQEFHPSLPLYGLIMMNFLLVFLLSIIYAWWVKDRVEIYADPPSTTTNGAEDESQPLLGISKAALDPMAHKNSAHRHFIHTVYIMHLILCRILPLIVFTALLLTSSNFPVEYHCPWPVRTTSTSLQVNLTQRQSMNNSTVNCVYLMGSNKEKVAATVVAVNFLMGSVAFTELAYLLWSTWKDDNLLTDLEFCSVYLLRKRKRIRKLMKKIRMGIKDNFFRFHGYTGEELASGQKLEEMYINVIIRQGRDSNQSSRKRLENRHETYEAHLKLPADATILKRTADLFEPRSGHQPKTILVLGRPGIGKTLLTKKLFYQWKQQDLEFFHDKIVILIRFRKFNNTMGRTSLREMLRCSDGLDMSSADFNHIYEYICLFPNSLVLIFDGLDELKIDHGLLTDEKTVDSHNEFTHILLIFEQLVKGKLLPGATVLTTSRPTAEQNYERLEFDLEVEILGFHEEQIKDYVERFCRHTDTLKSSEIWNLIKESPELLTLCYIPVNNYIVCLTLKESIDADSRRNFPKTITELYKRAVNILLHRNHFRYPPMDKPPPKNYGTAKLSKQLQNDLDKLKGIARNGMIDGQLIFELENDDELVAGLSDCGLFNKLEDDEWNIFCFLHLTIQEFLAALHIVDDMENVESFLSKHITIPRWHLVIQFVAGLIGDQMKELKAERNKLQRSSNFTNNERTQEKLAKLAKNEETIKRICKRFQDLMPKVGRGIDLNTNAFFVIKCVHEMQDDSVMKLIASCGREYYGEEFLLRLLNITPLEFTALFEFLSHVKDLHKLTIFNCNMDDFAARALAKSLKKNTMVVMGDKWKLTKLDISNNSLTHEGAKHLCDALTSDMCKLTELYISFNYLAHEGAKHLSDALMNDKCKLTKLDIGGNNLTHEGAKHLCDALMSDKCKLTELDISSNNLTHEGAKHISDALMSGKCKLTKLDISNNNLTQEGAKHLRNVLMSDKCKLTELYMYGNSITYELAEHFRDVLNNDNCKLTNLDMGC